MGSCISKCKPKKKTKRKACEIVDDHQEFCCQIVHDKLVISQQQSGIPIPKSSSSSSSSRTHRKPVLPYSHTSSASSSSSSTTSFSSVSGGISSNSTSSEFSISSSSSSSSSYFNPASISKDYRGSFSNEFLWACAKENPQIIGRSIIKGPGFDQKPSDYKVHRHNKFDSPTTNLVQKPASVFMKQLIRENQGGATPKKRARANSPTLVRQKSFRKDPDPKVISSSPANSTYHLPNRTALMRSPSPSRRFNGEIPLRDSPMKNTAKDPGTNYSRRSTVVKSNRQSTLSSASLRRENFKIPQSPNYDFGTKSGTIMKINRDAALISHQQEIGQKNSKIEVAEKELDKNQMQDLEAMVIEDVHNPLIALDCFIFL
ncbi:OLC1v1016478C1 [Oldenlandia corymbosa var. corymbosa]|uniref:OLC1v1016478C1 n=1 Tax=Oldenlandia corymbosa var. corymbosa TaxID=529605 RepID=A0AAV1E5U9_OLDCO|nr:OLC1v1016478C1 [Oldenlandia corymbosa var. corymbosa]